MPSWLKIATWLLLASIATFSFKKPTFFWDKTNINDLLLLLSFACLIVAGIKKEIQLPICRSVLIWGIIGLGSIVLATTISILHLHILAPQALREYARIFADSAIAYEIYCIGSVDGSLVCKSLSALVLSSILLPFIFYAPISIRTFFLDDSLTRFTGFLYDPNYYATLELLPAFIFAWKAFTDLYKKKRLLSIISFLLFSLSIGSIMWSGSRGSVAGLLVGMATVIGFGMWKKISYKKLGVLVCLLITGLLLGYVLLPRTGQQNITSRVGAITQAQPPLENGAKPSGILHIPAPLQEISAQQGRQVIWENALVQIINNPLGYGTDYGNVTDIQGGNNDHHRVAHNTFLQILLTGGVVLLVTLTVGTLALARKIMAARAPFGVIYFLSAALISIMAAGFFLDSLWSRWVWIIIGLLLLLAEHKDTGRLTLEHTL